MMLHSVYYLCVTGGKMGKCICVNQQHVKDCSKERGKSVDDSVGVPVQ